MARSAKKASKPSSIKILIYAAIGIVAVIGAVAYSLMPRAPQGPPAAGQDDDLQKFYSTFCGEGKVNSNSYVKELALPSKCEMPNGIAVDSSGVWYFASKNGTLGSYSLSDEAFSKAYKIPDSRGSLKQTDLFGSGTIKLDSQGNPWITSDRFSSGIYRFNKAEESFDIFYLPGNATSNFPISFDFDSTGKAVYLVGIRTPSLFIGDISNMRNGTSEGIAEVPFPLDKFEGVDKRLISSGSVAVDDVNGIVWATVLAFKQKGMIFGYDLSTKQLLTFDLPPDLNSPAGSIVDISGNLWVADHGTSKFFKLDPKSGQITQYVTSAPSSRIFGGSSPPPDAYSLPFWFQRGSGGELWFNEHTGNRIARFDPVSGRLVEYWIPSQNGNWVTTTAGCRSSEGASCGLANVLQFSTGPNDQVWFSEWTENKLGSIDSRKELPVEISVDKDEVAVARGDSIEIMAELTAGSAGFDGKMISSGTLTPTGSLGNSTGIFSQESVVIDAGNSKQISFTFVPAQDLSSGSYTIMIGAENDEITYLRPVKITIL